MKDTLEIQLQDEKRKVDEVILRERKKAHLQWESLRSAAKETILEIETESKAKLADEDKRIVEVKRQATRKLSRAKEQMDEELRQLKSKHEREWDELTRVEMGNVLEEERQATAKRISVEEMAEEKRKDVKAKLKADNEELYDQLGEVVVSARLDGRERMTKAAKKWFEDKSRREIDLILAQQKEAEASRRHRERDRRAKSERDESKRRAAEERRKGYAKERIVKAWAKYEPYWGKVKGRQGPLKTPNHAFDIQANGIQGRIPSSNDSPRVSVEEKLISELRRWDEDAFADILSRATEADKTEVELGANLVRAYWEELLEQSEGEPSISASTRSSSSSRSLHTRYLY
ncbi:hypothetical protein HETIRDRAFT_418396 [Heterobasidion irregulare TC 32-1]|uniref:Uncharacterized protein n=1 Tax=Heterobasidion irregulare (strain TC 32-1) TaxID=747525 RepID=W4K3R7_HETIT|nr:uncharacterized protein HETIRDRAFT_418396 [Heterobasidion irregulare TC 32-1]ETW80374.1 hypothetical protein HETIRDRAFT_418396 [Heterobasidion irregulare TC 32-1]